MTRWNERDGSWSLLIERDGTEDVGRICDAGGDVLVTSRPFWRPEGDDPMSPTLAALQLMTAAPKLLTAARATLTALELILEVDDPATAIRCQWEADPLTSLRAAIADADAGELIPELGCRRGFP